MESKKNIYLKTYDIKEYVYAINLLKEWAKSPFGFAPLQILLPRSFFRRPVTNLTFPLQNIGLPLNGTPKMMTGGSDLQQDGNFN